MSSRNKPMLGELFSIKGRQELDDGLTHCDVLVDEEENGDDTAKLTDAVVRGVADMEDDGEAEEKARYIAAILLSQKQGGKKVGRNKPPSKTTDKFFSKGNQ